MTDYVLICRGTMDFTGGNPVCNGEWVATAASDIANAFDVTLLDPVTVVEAFGAGFIVMGVPLLVILAGRMILGVIKDDRKER